MGTTLLTFKYSVFTPLGDIAAHAGKGIGLVETLRLVSEALPLSEPLSYDRVRRELSRDGVSTSVVTVVDYAGKKGATKLVVLVAAVQYVS